MNRVIYLTGAPATGKSSLLKSLVSKRTDIVGFSYGEELTKVLVERGSAKDQTDLRRDSAKLVSPEDVAEADRRLAGFIARERVRAHIVIDSHAVTKESWGFRCTPFRASQLDALFIDRIVCLYAAPEVIADRIRASSGGRPLPTEHDIDMHNKLQCAVALSYAIAIGKTAYFLDSGVAQEELVQAVDRILH